MTFWKSKYKIVQFPDGTFAVRRGNRVFGYQYLDKDDYKSRKNPWWPLEHTDYARLSEFDEAVALRRKYIEYLKANERRHKKRFGTVVHDSPVKTAD